jgi:hypothetical protein
MDRETLELPGNYLISPFSHTMANGLSSAQDGQVSHDTVCCRAMNWIPSSCGFCLAKPMVRRHERDDGVIVFDDTIEEKPHTKESGLASTHTFGCLLALQLITTHTESASLSSKQ